MTLEDSGTTGTGVDAYKDHCNKRQWPHVPLSQALVNTGSTGTVVNG